MYDLYSIIKDIYKIYNKAIYLTDQMSAENRQESILSQRYAYSLGYIFFNFHLDCFEGSM